LKDVLWNSDLIEAIHYVCYGSPNMKQHSYYLNSDIFHEKFDNNHYILFHDIYRMSLVHFVYLWLMKDLYRI
jgi:hypothetical protein